MFGRLGVNLKLVVIIIYHGICLVSGTSHIDHILTSHVLLVYKVSSTLLKTFCEMKRFAKVSSHKNWQRIGKRAWYLRCSVSLRFVDEEVYDVIYRYMTCVMWRHFKWRQRWATFRFWAGSAPEFSTWMAGRKVK